MTPIDLVFLAAMGVLTFVPRLYALWYFCNGRSRRFTKAVEFFAY